jgi:type VI secretion system secreted protein VgrG
VAAHTPQQLPHLPEQDGGGDREGVFSDPVYKQLEIGEVKWKANERTHPPREYCVQYRESDFNFVSRLLEDEGIYYWFQDTDGKEALILTDTPAAHDSVAG